MKTVSIPGIGLTAALLLASLPTALRADTIPEPVEDPDHRQAEIYHTLEERKRAGLMRKITERVFFSGLLEFEAFYEHLDLAEGDEKSSDLVLATAQIGFEVEVNEHLGATLILIFEEDQSSGVDVDEATLDYERSGWSARLGLQDVPSGVFPSHMISGPLTEELGEMQATALRAGYGADLFELSTYITNGDVDARGDDDHIDHWGVKALVRPSEFLEVGGSYLSDLADTDAELVETLTKDVGGWSMVGVVTAGDFEVLGEFLGAAKKFDAADLDTDDNGEGDRPRAWNLEAAWEVSEVLELAARIEGSDEFPGEPELQYGACVSWSPWENVSLSFEYLRGEFDEAFGEGAKRRDLLTTQLALEF